MRINISLLPETGSGIGESGKSADSAKGSGLPDESSRQFGIAKATSQGSVHSQNAQGTNEVIAQPWIVVDLLQGADHGFDLHPCVPAQPRTVLQKNSLHVHASGVQFP